MWMRFVRLKRLGMIAALLPTVSAAQVIEIGDDGSVVRYDGPALYLGGAAMPIIAAVRPRRAARSAPISGDPVMAAIEAAATAHNISRDLAFAVAWHESRLRPDVVSKKGAIGVMQLMPATARSLGVNPYDATANVEGGVRFLSNLLHRYDGDLVKSLAAYSAGPGAVDRYKGVPPFRETQDYVASILSQLAPGSTAFVLRGR